MRTIDTALLVKNEAYARKRLSTAEGGYEVNKWSREVEHCQRLVTLYNANNSTG